MLLDRADWHQAQPLTARDELGQLGPGQVRDLDRVVMGHRLLHGLAEIQGHRESMAQKKLIQRARSTGVTWL